MITQQQLTDKCTPEIIKKMVELAEGFEYIECEYNYYSIAVAGEQYGKIIEDDIIFPLLVHRSVEGWNKLNATDNDFIFIGDNYIHYSKDSGNKFYELKDYQPTTLTHAECAMLDCLLEVLK